MLSADTGNEQGGQYACDRGAVKTRRERAAGTGGSDGACEAPSRGAQRAKLVRSKSVDADETRQRPAAAGVVRAGDCGGRGDADRLREFVELAAGARHDTAKGNCDSRNARSGEDAA